MQFWEVAEGKDDPRRGTSRCKDPEVEHTWWLAKSTQGESGGRWHAWDVDSLMGLMYRLL